jgi:hypothetical protein
MRVYMVAWKSGLSRGGKLLANSPEIADAIKSKLMAQLNLDDEDVEVYDILVLDRVPEDVSLWDVLQ